MMTATKEHIWVKHTITPVHVITGGDGEPVVFVDPDQVPIAEETAAYGCNICGNPLFPYDPNTECPGDTE